MYSESILKDARLLVKATISNQIARFFPKLYVRLTAQTGRGNEEENAEQIAGYFTSCFDDYQVRMNLDADGIRQFLRGRTILEYGPGDIFGVALLFYAHGAAAVHCVDRFPLSSITKKGIEVYERLLGQLEGEVKSRGRSAFKTNGDPASGFRPEAVSYAVTKDGLSGAIDGYDLIISRAVLEHVNNLDATFRDIERALKPGGISIHQVDLKSHGLDRYAELDFLTWPRPLYKLMYSHKGFPNRWRVDKFRESATLSHLNITSLEPTNRLGLEAVEKVRPKLAAEFKNVPAEELRWLSFWLHLNKNDPRFGDSRTPAS